MAIDVTTDDGDKPLRGIVLLATGICVFMIQDVVIKLLSGGYPVHEMLWIRCVTGLPLLLVLAWRAHDPSNFRIHGPGVLRGLLHILSFTLYYLALATLPMAEAATLYYAAPLMITALSVPILREVVGIRRWLAVLVGFAGVIIVLQPGGTIDIAMLYALGSAFSYALSMMVNRWAGKRVSSISFALHSVGVLFIASSIFALAFGDGRYDDGSATAFGFLMRAWAMPQGWDLLMLASIGPVSAIGFLLLSEAYRIAPASLVSPFEYSSLPVAILAGYLVFHDLPAVNTWFGLALIIGSGLYILHREQVRQRNVNRGWPPIRPRL